MPLKLQSALATSILIGSGLAPLALTAQPAQALEICIGDDPVSVNVEIESIDSNWVDDGQYLNSNEAGIRRSEIRTASRPWYDFQIAQKLSSRYTCLLYTSPSPRDRG